MIVPTVVLTHDESKEMTDPAKLVKLLSRVRGLITHLDREHGLVIHQNVNQFYYMQKSEELKILLERFQDEQKKQETLSHWIEVNYNEVFRQWRKDMRWLSLHVDQQAKPGAQSKD